ncbi:MAG TPA: DUF2950 family protein [Steroidobacteraceae bacterium]|nr:DUF2950 family protein [Steroidobacteraceae bacterium]
MNSKQAAPARVAFAMVALFLAAYAPLCVAGKSTQPTFTSAEEASHALFLAVRNHNERAVTEILQAGNSPISADEEFQDRLDRERFVQKYQEMHRFVQEADGGMVLYIGAENWPFPIPLVSRNGVWRFDSDNGAHEIRYRRIGKNELTAIALCQALVAQSHPGAVGAPDGATAAVLAAAKSGGRPVAFHGYYLRTLAGSDNRVAAIAYPAAYRSSGVMTFTVDPDGDLYEKDLGPNTGKVAGTMTGYRIDGTWTPAESTP